MQWTNPHNNEYTNVKCDKLKPLCLVRLFQGRTLSACVIPCKRLLPSLAVSYNMILMVHHLVGHSVVLHAKHACCGQVPCHDPPWRACNGLQTLSSLDLCSRLADAGVALDITKHQACKSSQLIQATANLN